MNQMVATRILRSLGCSYEIVDNGRKAVAACMAGNFDVILMDCHMPDMVRRERPGGGGRQGRPADPPDALKACLALTLESRLGKT